MNARMKNEVGDFKRMLPRVSLNVYRANSF